MNRAEFQQKLSEAGITSPITKVITRAKKRNYFTKRTTSFSCSEVEEIIAWEKARVDSLIAKGLDPITGCFSKGCQVNKNKVRTDETRAKISSTLKDNQNAKGVHNISVEQRQCWSELRKGIEPPNKGKKMSEEQRQKVSEGVKRAIQEGKCCKKTYFCHCYHFDSSWECIYYLSFCGKTETGRPIYPSNVVRNTTLRFEYEYNSQKHRYYPDFIVDGKPVEVKGIHLLGQNVFDHSKDGLFRAKYQCMIDNNVEIVTDIQPFMDNVEKKFCPEFWELFRTDIPFPGNTHHPANDDIWKCRVKGHLSPLEAWNDSEIRTKAAFNRLVYGNVGEYHKYATPKPKDVLAAFTIAKLAPKVSEFSIGLARRLIQEYAVGKTIVDPFAGFGARKQAAEELGFEYHGFDIEAKNGLDITIRDILSDYPVEEYDTLFTCSPYGDKEEWLTGCHNMTCDEWIDVCLSKFKCKRYIFVVDKTDKYKDKVVGHCNNNGMIGKNGKEMIVCL